MNDRRDRSRVTNRVVAYIATGVVHAVIIGSLLINFTGNSNPTDTAYAEKVDTVKATTVDEEQIKKQQDKLKQEERDKKRKQEQQRKDLEKLKKQSDLEKKRIADLKKQQKVERNKAAELEKQRKAISLKKQQEEEQRDKEVLERKRKEELVAEKIRQQQELERIEREQQELEAQRLMNESIAAEEAFLAEQLAKQRTVTLVGKYAGLIKQKVISVRTIAPDFERWRVATVNIKLSSLGEVLSARIIQSSGSERYDRSVESAILKASPLPIPDANTDAAANQELRNIDMTFPMPGA